MFGQPKTKLKQDLCFYLLVELERWFNLIKFAI